MFLLTLCLTIFTVTVTDLAFCDVEKTCESFTTIEVLQRFNLQRTALPWTKNDADTKGWNQISTYKKFNLKIYRFKSFNNFFIFFYGTRLVGVGPTYKYGFIYQGEVSSEEESNKDKKKQQKTFWSKITSFFNNKQDDETRAVFKHYVTFDKVDYEYALILFVDPDMLSTKSRHPCVPTTAIFFEGRSGTWHSVPILEKEIKPDSNMVKQGCLAKFGNYYFYSLYNRTACEDIHGFFSFYDNQGQMNGFGIFYKGSEILWEDNDNPNPLYRFWNVQEAKDIVPTNEKCVTSMPYDGYTAINLFIRPREETDEFRCL